MEEVKDETFQDNSNIKKSKWWIWLIIALVVIGVGIGIYIWFNLEPRSICSGSECLENKIQRTCGGDMGDYELRVYDSEGRVTGSINGEEKRDIPGSFYYPKQIVPVGVPGSINGVIPAEIIIFEPQGEYIHEVYGIKEGFYNLNVGNFNAINISIYPGETHRYSLNIDSLKKGEDEFPVLVDLNKDKEFEIEFKSDSTLTCEEFNSKL